MKLIRICGFQDAVELVEDVLNPPGDPPRFLKSMNFEARDGRGVATFTSDPRKAMKFADAGEAMKFYTTQSRTVPVRPDGKPNRPLTAYSIEVMEEPRD